MSGARLPAVPIVTDQKTNSNSSLGNVGDLNICIASHIPLFYVVVLNDLIFQQLQELLHHTNTSLNNLLSVSRTFESIKKTNFYWKLNKRYSLTYYKSVQYRERIALLTNIKTQLSLNLRDCFEVSNVSVLADIHTLDLSQCGKVTGVNTLDGVHSLHLTGCYFV
jgi:hypothetical protein